MSVGESLGSHSLHSFAEFLQSHINSPEASSCLTSRLKPLHVLKPFSLNFMATEKSARKGGRQHRGNTSKDLPPDLRELYKTDPEETYTGRKNRIQWIQRYWAEEWFKYFLFFTVNCGAKPPQHFKTLLKPDNSYNNMITRGNQK